MPLICQSLISAETTGPGSLRNRRLRPVGNAQVELNTNLCGTSKFDTARCAARSYESCARSSAPVPIPLTLSIDFDQVYAARNDVPSLSRRSIRVCKE